MNFYLLGGGLVLLAIATYGVRKPLAIPGGASGRHWKTDPESAERRHRRSSHFMAILYGGLGLLMVFLGLTTE